MNLAEEITDGQHIHVPSNKEYKKEYNKEYKSNNGVGSVNEDTKYSLININTATAEELMQLPGIGESKANAIITFRNDSGSFSAIEEIMQVPGIKEGAFAKIKSLIKV